MTPALSPAHIDRFRLLVEEHLGLTFDEARLEYLTDALRQRLAATGSPADRYLRQLDSRGSPEFAALAPLLTVGETYFFRNADHFRALTESIIPSLVATRGSDRSFRVLSAGCSSGEEAFTLAILLKERADLANFRIQLRAIDVNRAALDKARCGRYSAWSLRGTPAEVRARYFMQQGKELVLSSVIREMVQFEERNLLEPDPTFWRAGCFDVVFCRNVTMYFPPDTTRKVVERIAYSLRGDGYLFLGHAETLRGVSNEFHLCHTHNTFYYQKRGAEAPLVAHRTTSDSWASQPAAANGVAPQGRAIALAPPSAQPTGVEWMDAITRASDHIARLADGSSEPLPSCHPSDAGAPRMGSQRSALGEARNVPQTRAWNTQPALHLLREERFGEALAFLGGLPAESHADPDAQLLRAVLQTNTGDLLAAERTCAQLLAVDELNAGAHYLTALAREQAGDVDGAIEHNQMAAYLDPTFAMPRLHLGLLNRRCNRPDLAKLELQRALGLLLREDASRVLLFGGGFSREVLSHMCRTELQALERNA